MKQLKLRTPAGFANDLFEMYLKNSFGSLNKTELEELFIELLRRHSNLREMSNFEISINLHIPESKVRNMLYQSQLKYVDFSVQEIRQNLFYQLWSGFFEVLEDGRIYITIENKYIKQAVEAIVKGKGMTPIGTFNKETLILTTDGFSELIPELFAPEEIKLINEELKVKKCSSFSKAIKSLIKPETIKDNIVEICGSLIAETGKAFVVNQFVSLLTSA